MKSKTYLFSNSKWNKPLPEFKVSENTCVIVFGNNKEVVSKIQKDYPGLNLIGSMSSGNIYNGSHHESTNSGDDNLVLTYWEFETTKVKIHWHEFGGYDFSFKAGTQMMTKFDPNGLAGLFVLAEGLNVNGAKLAEGMQSLNHSNIPVIGGLSADNMKFEETCVYTPDGPKSVSVVAIGFYGSEFNMLAGSKSGVTPFGVERKITKSEKNVLFELDDKPALDVYESFLGDESIRLPASGMHFPVEISSNFDQKEGLLRTPIMIDRELKTITFTGEIPEGEYLRLMFAQLDSLTIAAEQVGEKLYQEIGSKLNNGEYCSISISCAARKAVLKSDLDDEIRPSYEKFGKHDDSNIGFYSYGEIVTLNQKCSLVNQTMSQFIIWESKK